MTSRVMRVLALAVLLVAASAIQTEALPIVSVSPATQTVPLGPVSIDILVSGLGPLEEVGGFSLLLSFDDSILSGDSFVNDPDAKMGAGTDFSFGFLPGGILDLFYIAEDFIPLGPGPEDDAALKALQGDGFTLATINFTAIAEGTSKLNLSVIAPGGTILSDAQGFDLPAQAVNGSVCVSNSGACAVPEPASFSLIATAIGALVVQRRRNRRVRPRV